MDNFTMPAMTVEMREGVFLSSSCFTPGVHIKNLARFHVKAPKNKTFVSVKRMEITVRGVREDKGASI